MQLYEKYKENFEVLLVFFQEKLHPYQSEAFFLLALPYTGTDCSKHKESSRNN
jgi:hypothetical protein